MSTCWAQFWNPWRQLPDSCSENGGGVCSEQVFFFWFVCLVRMSYPQEVHGWYVTIRKMLGPKYYAGTA